MYIYRHKFFTLIVIILNSKMASTVVASPSIPQNICAFCGTSCTAKCNRCKSVYYCGPICQATDWKLKHRKTCIQSITLTSAFAWRPSSEPTRTTSMTRSVFNVLNNIATTTVYLEKLLALLSFSKSMDRVSHLDRLLDEISQSECKFVMSVMPSIRVMQLSFMIIDRKQNIIVNQPLQIMPALPDDYKHIYLSSCLLAPACFLDLCSDISEDRQAKKHSIPGDRFALATFGSSGMTRSGIKAGYELIVPNRSCNGRYKLSLLQTDTISRFISVGESISSVAFLIVLHPINCDNPDEKLVPNSVAADADEKELLKSLQSEWLTISSKPMKSHHKLVLLISLGEWCIIQSFGSHYTILDWIKFEQKLTQMRTPPPICPDFLGKVNPSPKYRGILSCGDQLTLFMKDIDSLTHVLDHGRGHLSAYERITGVTLSEQVMPCNFAVSMMRLDLTK